MLLIFLKTYSWYLFLVSKIATVQKAFYLIEKILSVLEYVSEAHINFEEDY